VLGAVNIMLNGNQIGAVDLLAASDIPAGPTFWTRLLGVLRRSAGKAHPFKGGMKGGI
jgi:hypothetical protein